ncbi:MAG: serine/threonine protein kinase [Nocardioides sp.]|nr:serine/threonine protein kinase [Nocardioides sp.]
MTPTFPSEFLTPDHTDPLDGIDERFVFDFRSYDDDLAPGQRWSQWEDLEALMRGPEPRPSWVITSSGAVDTDLGILKTGKEADVFLVERCDPHRPDSAVVMAAKRYRDTDHRSFHRAAAYTEGRSMKRSRDNRALKRKTTWGRVVAAGEWAASEWSALRRCWELGLPVPYPVQIDGTEILMEWITHEGETAPRLAGTRPGPDLLADLLEQVREVLASLAAAGLVHGDLSPYNTLLAGDRLVVIDLPQVIDLAGNPQGFDFLLRDCANMCRWFRARGLEVDEQELFSEVVAGAF